MEQGINLVHIQICLTWRWQNLRGNLWPSMVCSRTKSTLSLWGLSLRKGLDNLQVSPSGLEPTVSSITPCQCNTINWFYYCFPLLNKSFKMSSAQALDSLRLCSLGQDTDSNLAGAVLHHSPVSTEKNVRNFKSQLKHEFLQNIDWTFSLPPSFLFLLQAQVAEGDICLSCWYEHQNSWVRQLPASGTDKTLNCCVHWEETETMCSPTIHLEHALIQTEKLWQATWVINFLSLI